MGEGRKTTGGRAPPPDDASLVELASILTSAHQDAEAMCDTGTPEDQGAWKFLMARRGLMLGLIGVTPAATAAGLVAKARVLSIPDLSAVDPAAGWQLAASLAADVIRLEGVRAHG